ncbi:MAG: GNAT family N-acetyltransferase [Chloroflexi bacterium]|nr:GNAT family N-acetyltransferase [Chloroflexota bacterium]
MNDIVLPNDFTFRPAVLADAASVADVANASANKYIGTSSVLAQEMARFWQLPEFDLEKSARVAVDGNGRVIAYIDVDDTGSRPVRPNFLGHVHPDFEGQGIGAALVNWAERRARQVLPKIPVDLRVTVDTGIWAAAKPSIQLLETHGYTHSRDFWRMVIEFNGEPAAPTWPTGITLNSLIERPELRPIIAAREEAFQDHWGHVPRPIEEQEAEWRHWLADDPHHDPAGWWLAMDGEEIAGLCLCRQQEHHDAEMGWVSILAVRRPYRLQGLGLALLQHSFVEFYQKGRKRVGLGVDADNLTGATRLYKKAGMTVQRHDMVFEKELRPGLVQVGINACAINNANCQPV